jgi:hypothetical protein
MTQPHTISSINRLPETEKRQTYARVIPSELLDRYKLSPFLVDKDGNDLLRLVASPGSSSVEMILHHKIGFPDPILYGHITDTINGQIHILLYVLNDPDSPRFDVDRLPDGTPTSFGINHRNIEAETAAIQAGLTPGQIRRGPRLLSEAILSFERFVESLGHDLYFAEPLYYHNAVIFEHQGFNYQQGRRRMEMIERGFCSGGDFLPLLDGSTPFRQPEAANSIRLRSWAIHDGIFGEPFTNFTMYKQVGKHAGISTCSGCDW